MATGDIREIDMTKATDANGKKIRLVGDDGKGYWMEFSDLAAVVGELIGVVDDENNGLASTITSLFYRGKIDDCNTLEQGVFTIKSDTLNRPEPETHTATLISIRAYNDGVYMYQKVISQMNGNDLYVRRKN